MKILIVTGEEWGHIGGLEQYLINTIKALALAGHETVVMYPKKGERPVDEKLPVKAEYEVSSLYEYPNHRNAGDTGKVLNIIRKENIDVVYLREMKNYRILEAVMEDVPVVARFHGCLVTCLRDGTKTFYFGRKVCERKLGLGCYAFGCFLSKPLKGSIIPRFNNIIHAKRRLDVYRKLKRILVASNYTREELVKNGFEYDRIVELPHNPAEAIKIESQELDYSHRSIVFAGRIDRYKGVDFLLEALSLIKDGYRAEIIGEGTYLETCKRISGKLRLGDKVNFRGWIPNEMLREFYLRSRMVAIPSIWPEPYPRVGVEAQSFARPIVGFAVGGMRDLVSDGEDGFLVKVKDSKALADRIRRLLDSEELARKMGGKGYLRYLSRPYHTEYIRRLIEVFQSAIDDKDGK